MPHRPLLRNSPRYLRALSYFILASILAIFGTTLMLSSYLATYMERQMLLRDAVVSMEFLNSISRVEGADRFLANAGGGVSAPQLEAFFGHVSRLPDMVRANVYSSTGEILWSSDPELIGQSFADNDELRRALRGELHPSIAVTDRNGKAEHVGLPGELSEFMEIYIPIRSASGDEIVGAVEVYKTPEKLFEALRGIVRLAGIGGILAGAVLFAALVAVALYSIQMLRRQEARLIEAERLAVVGEMASAVAHGLRNPLAAIRSCAELVAEEEPDGTTRGLLQDIVDQVDRLEVWIRSFLVDARADAGAEAGAGAAQVEAVVRHCIQGFAAQLSRHDIRVELCGCEGRPVAAVGAGQLEQVINAILANAIEAMSGGGCLRIGWSSAPGPRVLIRIADSGPGLSSEALHTLFAPFQSSKPSGLGIGLALSRRIAERFGGTLELRNGSEKGVVVTLTVPESVQGG
ncbi:MAG: sensor histidine kinase [Limimaricola sp.]